MRKKLYSYRWCSPSTIRLTRLDLIHMLSSSKSISFDEEKFKQCNNSNSKFTFAIDSFEKRSKKISLLSLGKKEIKRPTFYWEIEEKGSFAINDYSQDKGFIAYFSPYFISFGRNGKEFPENLQLASNVSCLICGKKEKWMKILDIGDRYECVCDNCNNAHKLFRYFEKEQLAIKLLMAVA